MGRDLRQYSRQTNLRLVLGFILVLFVVGDGLIYLFYGRNAAIAGFLCLFAALGPVILIFIALSIINWIARRNDQG